MALSVTLSFVVGIYGSALTAYVYAFLDKIKQFSPTEVLCWFCRMLPRRCNDTLEWAAWEHRGHSDQKARILKNTCKIIRNSDC